MTVPPSPTGIVVRPLAPDDIPAFLALIDGLAAYEHLAPPDGAARARLAADALAQPPPFSVLLGEIGGEVVAYAVYFRTYSTFLARPTLYLEDIFVLPGVRGQGIGRALLAACAREALRHGCGRLEWQVLAWNTPAVGFYEHLGAQPLHADWRCYRLEGDSLRALGS